MGAVGTQLEGPFRNAQRGEEPGADHGASHVYYFIVIKNPALSNHLSRLCSFDLRLQEEEGSHYSVDDDLADWSVATGTFTPRLGVGREMPSFFIL